MIKPSLLRKLQQIQERFAVVEGLLSAPDSASDLQQFRALSKERSDLAPVVDHFGELQKSERDLKEAEAWLADPDLKEFGQEELLRLKRLLEEQIVELQRLLLPKDPNDGKAIILEIRAGTGGDESALFSGDLLRIYLRFAERNRWNTEML